MNRYHRLVGLVLVVIAFVGAGMAAFYLEGPIPVHWNIEGEVDDWMDKPWGLLILPLGMLLIFLVFQVIGMISPQGYRLESFQRTVGIFQNGTLFFLALVMGAQLLHAGGVGIDMVMVMTLGVGVLFVVLGNFLGKTRKNFFIGIRTPWTLASDEVWIRTHRLGGWVFVVIGVVLLIAAPFGGQQYFLLGGALVAVLVPTLYSLWIYRQLEGFDSGNEDS